MAEPAEPGAVAPGHRVAEGPGLVAEGPERRVAEAGPAVEPAESEAVLPGVEPAGVVPEAVVPGRRIAEAVVVLPEVEPAGAASPAVVLAGVTERKVAAAGPAVEPAALLHRIDRREPRYLFLVHILYISYETPS